MAAFPSRSRADFMAHWERILGVESNVLKTILVGGAVAGNIGSWEDGGERNVGYWLGREFWGRGIATAALTQFVELVKPRPLRAYVTKHNAASIRVLQKCGFEVRGEGTVSDAEGTEVAELILVLVAPARGDPASSKA